MPADSTSIIDPDAIPNIEEVIKKIDDLEKKIDEANTKAITVQVEFKGADSIAACTAAIEKQKEALSDLQSAQDEARNVIAKYGQAQVQVAQNIINAGNTLKDLKQQLAEVSRQWENASKAGSQAADALAQKMENLKSQMAQLAPQAEKFASGMGDIGAALMSAREGADKTASRFDNLFGTVGKVILAMTGLGFVWNGFIKLLQMFNKETAGLHIPEPPAPQKKFSPPNTKNLNAELKAAEEERKTKHDIALKEFEQSKQTEQDKIDLLNKTVNAETEGKQKEFEILDKYKGKTGETQQQELARYAQYTEKYAGLAARAAKTRSAITKEIEAEYEKAGQANKTYIAELQDHDKQIAQLQAAMMDKKAQYEERQATSGIDLFGGKAAKREDFDANLAIGQAQSTVRGDNSELSAAKTRVDVANLNVQKHEVTPGGKAIPMEQRDAVAYSKALQEKQKAQEEFDKWDVKATEDTDNVTSMIHQQSTDKETEENEKKKQMLHEIADLSVQLAQETFSAISTIRDNAFAAEQQQLEIKQQEIQLASQQQMQAIEATAGFQVTKDNELAKLAAQTAAEQNAIQQEQNNLALKKARADKQAAEASVVMNTASAIMKIWAGYAGQAEVGAALAAAETALVVGIGAAQYPAAASTPLPQFAQGGITRTPFFIAGEAGAEIIAPPGQKPFIADKPAIFHQPVGTEIIPVHKMVERMRGNVLNPAHTGEDIASLQLFYNNHIIASELARIYKGNKESAEDVVTAIYKTGNKPIKNTVVVDMKNALQRPK